MNKLSSLLLALGLTISGLSAQNSITVFDFDAVTPTGITWSDTFSPDANPALDATNPTAVAGKYTHKTAWSDVSVNVNIDPRIYTSYDVLLYSPVSITGTATIVCYDDAGGQLDWYTQPVTTSGKWLKFTRNITFAKKIARVMIGFNRDKNASGTSDDILYFDELVFKKTTSTKNITLYKETFFASWSEWGDWSGDPSTKDGNWNGGINLKTDNNASVKLSRGWNDNHDHRLTMEPTAAAVTFANIDVVGFDSLKVSADMFWPWSNGENTPFYSVSNAQKTPKFEVRLGTGSWVTVAMSALTSGWVTQTALLTDTVGGALSGSKPISIRITGPASITAGIDNIKISGNIIKPTTTTISESEKSDICVYPNPASDYFIVKGAQKVLLLDLNGKLITQSVNSEKTDISSVSKGVYLVKAFTGNRVIVSKLIKK